MSNITYMVVGDVAAHEGRVVQLDWDDVMTDENPGGWRFQDFTAPHGTDLGQYDTRVEADAALAKWEECPAAERGEYCYSHNPVRD